MPYIKKKRKTTRKTPRRKGNKKQNTKRTRRRNIRNKSRRQQHGGTIYGEGAFARVYGEPSIPCDSGEV
jgi:hypothetical protein